VELRQLAPGAKVRCEVQHADGSSETLWLSHTYSASQLDWFRRGSALNVARGAARPAP
jgi:aconitate hydratase